MHQTACLAALAWIVVSGPSSAQSRPGSIGRTERSGPPPALAFRALGAFGGEPVVETERSVRIEMEGAQKLEGTVRFRPVIVESELGRYAIRPEKIRMIRFLKRAGEDVGKPGRPPEDETQKPVIPDGMFPARRGTLVRGKVITTSGKEIVGDIYIPTDFKLELDFGTLTLAPDKLRTLTMVEDEPAAEAPVPKADPGAEKPPAPNETGEAKPPARTEPRKPR